MKVIYIAASAVFLTVGAASADTVLGTGSWSGSESGAAFVGSTGSGTLGGISGASNTTSMNLSSTGQAGGFTALGGGAAISGSGSSTTSAGAVNNTSTSGSFGFGVAGASGDYAGTNGSSSGAFGGFGTMF